MWFAKISLGKLFMLRFASDFKQSLVYAKFYLHNPKNRLKILRPNFLCSNLALYSVKFANFYFKFWRLQ